MIRMIRLGLGAGLFALCLAAQAMAQDTSVGAEQFRVSCAVCHGLNGAGAGEFADVLTKKPADLTKLSARNGGVFPYLEVMRIVDGRTTLRAHGSSAMPIWGDQFTREVGDTAGPYGAELIVRARIVSLVDYLSTLQK